jgi:hypothetical protein
MRPPGSPSTPLAPDPWLSPEIDDHGSDGVEQIGTAADNPRSDLIRHCERYGDLSPTIGKVDV